MEQHTTITEISYPDLLQSPHMMRALTAFITEAWSPDVVETERLIEHLMHCLYCRTGLIVLLFGEQDWGKTMYPAEGAIDPLLIRFVTLHRELEMHNEEHLGVYAEMIMTKGKEEADKNFPLLAGHVVLCPHCRSVVEDMLNFLNE